MKRGDLILEQSELRRSYSRELWQCHLLRLEAGDLDLFVEEQGGVFEFLASVYLNSPDPPRAEAVFRSMLEEFVSRWLPEPSDDPRRTALFVDLVSGFLPQVGASRLLALLSKGPVATKFGEGVRIASPPERDVRKRALYALDAYFPSPPLMSSPAWDSYLRMLKLYVQEPAYASLAARLMLQRSIVEVDSKYIYKALLAEPRAAGDLLQTITQPPVWAATGDRISLLFSQVKKVGIVAFLSFEEALSACGGSIDWEVRSISFPGLAEVPIGQVKEDILAHSIELSWRGLLQDPGREIERIRHYGIAGGSQL